MALDVLRYLDTLPHTAAAQIVRWQLGRSASSVGANYRRACLAQSRKDFISKLKSVEEEADEAEFWLDLCVELRLGHQDEGARLRVEAGEIRAMTTASIKTSRDRLGDG